jgi:hypothetical protein
MVSSSGSRLFELGDWSIRMHAGLLDDGIDRYQDGEPMPTALPTRGRRSLTRAHDRVMMRPVNVGRKR